MKKLNFSNALKTIVTLTVTGITLAFTNVDAMACDTDFLKTGEVNETQVSSEKDNTVSDNYLNVAVSNEDILNNVSEENPDILLTEDERNALRGYWDGIYFATQGKTSLRLKIVSVAADGKVQAFFHFTEHQDNPGVPYGCYTMEGTYNPETKLLSLDGVKWLYKPSTYSFVDVHGNIDFSKKEITGYVSASYSKYEGLSLTKSMDIAQDTDIDSSISKYYEEYGQQGYGSIEDTIKVEKNGKKYSVTPIIDSKWNAVTVTVGNKIKINGSYDKKSFKTSNANIAKVSSKGIITAKKGGRVTISYKVDGKSQVINLVVIQPHVEKLDSKAIVKNMKVTVKKDDDIKLSLYAPINATNTKIINKNVISDLKIEMDNEGHFAITGKAVKKGKVTLKYTVNGKIIKVNINVKKR